MFWSKARKIRKLEEVIKELNSTITARELVISREKELKVAAQTSDTTYRKLAAERGDEIGSLKQELELLKASNYNAQQEAQKNAELYGSTLLERAQEIEQLKNAFEHERRLKDGYAQELNRLRGEERKSGLLNMPLDQIDSFVASGLLSDTKDSGA